MNKNLEIDVLQKIKEHYVPFPGETKTEDTVSFLKLVKVNKLLRNDRSITGPYPSTPSVQGTTCCGIPCHPACSFLPVPPGGRNHCSKTPLFWIWSVINLTYGSATDSDCEAVMAKVHEVRKPDYFFTLQDQ